MHTGGTFDNSKHFNESGLRWTDLIGLDCLKAASAHYCDDNRETLQGTCAHSQYRTEQNYSTIISNMQILLIKMEQCRQKNQHKRSRQTPPPPPWQDERGGRRTDKEHGQ